MDKISKCPLNFFLQEAMEIPLGVLASKNSSALLELVMSWL